MKNQRKDEEVKESEASKGGQEYEGEMTNQKIDEEENER